MSHLYVIHELNTTTQPTGIKQKEAERRERQQNSKSKKKS